MNRLLRLVVVLGLLVASIPAAPATADHVWSTYCGSGLGLTWIFENENFGGSQDSDCNADAEWGDAMGDIRNFHDKMTSFHASDRSGDGLKFCDRFFADANQGGSSFVASGSPIGNGVKYQDPNVGGTYNDWVDSHSHTGTSGSSC